MCNEEEIYKGNASVIRNLLIHIKYAYREDLLTIKCKGISGGGPKKIDHNSSSTLSS